jgi:ketosteroid isomerase-like protein
MAAEGVELVRSWFDAFNTRNIEAMLRLLDPRVEFHSVFAAVGGGIYRGHEGMRKWHRDLEDSWGDEIRLVPEVWFELDDGVLGFYEYRGRGRGSGAEVSTPAASVARFRNGLISYVKVYIRREDALQDLGVAEEELEPIPA